MIARNIAHQALLAGHTVLFTSAGHMLDELAGARQRHRPAPPPAPLCPPTPAGHRRGRLSVLLQPPRRPAVRDRLAAATRPSRTLITTNRPFAEWGEVFPNAACVVSLVDRLVHHAEIIAIEGESYRLKEAHERAEQRARQRRKSQVMSKVSNALPLTIPLDIPAYWTPEQAFAVVELLDDLRDRIWAHYGVQLLDQYREQLQPSAADHDPDTPPF